MTNKEEKDYSYLEPIAGELYKYVFNLTIHKLKQEKRKEWLIQKSSELTPEERAYVKAWVMNAFDLLRKPKKKSK